MPGFWLIENGNYTALAPWGEWWPPRRIHVPKLIRSPKPNVRKRIINILFNFSFNYGYHHELKFNEKVSRKIRFFANGKNEFKMIKLREWSGGSAFKEILKIRKNILGNQEKGFSDYAWVKLLCQLESFCIRFESFARKTENIKVHEQL